MTQHPIDPKARELDNFETQCWICPICFDDHRINDERAYCKTKDLEKLQQQNLKLTAALEKIANHKMNSVDKIYLIHQCEGFQTVAREALQSKGNGE